MNLAARAIAAAALGRDPGPMAAAESSSHHVYVSPDVVLKVIDAAGHSRLDREIALAPHLPASLTAPLLGSGLYQLETREVRYACYARVPGTAPGMGLPGVDGVTAPAGRGGGGLALISWKSRSPRAASHGVPAPDYRFSGFRELAS
jgi:hypothetical protein